MDFLNGSIRPMYFKYLSAAFGSAMITSMYSIVDTAMVGQYHGPEGTAALAVVAPVWNIIYSLGLLMGIGGSVIFSTKRGSGTCCPSNMCSRCSCSTRCWRRSCGTTATRAAPPLRCWPFNIFSTYYFQAIMKPRAAFVVSVVRGLVISGVLILLLPVLAGAEALWLAMPITEVLVMVYAAAVMRSYTAALKG